jgi:hypothetical protein
MSSRPELSVVLPCLDEADTVEACVRDGLAALERSGVAGEVVVADNGSRDRSRELARAAGARVVEVPERGYGAALQAGVGAARGRFVLMADADLSYDLAELPRFLARLQSGAELVVGCRLPVGGGTLEPGAMPWLHRRIGNPFLSFVARRLFGVPVRDVYCGMRAFTKDAWERLDLRCTGMELAVEMVVKARLAGLATEELPITLRPDGRRTHAPHLRTFRDGWRTLRWCLLASPRWLLLAPGVALVAAGLLGYALALPGVRVEGARLDAHTLLVASLALLVGHQALAFAALSQAWAAATGLLPEPRGLARLRRAFTLERGLLIAALLVLAGLALVAKVFLAWRAAGYGDLDYPETMRFVIPGTTLAALGVQTALAGAALGLLGLTRR